MRLGRKLCDSHVKFARNSYEIRTNFVRISCEFHISRIFTQIYSREIRTNFVRIYVNFFQLHANHNRNRNRASLPCYLWHSKCDRRQLGSGCCHRCFI